MKRPTLGAVLTQIFFFALGILSGVLGNFAYEWAQQKLAGPTYQYGPVVPMCASDAGWTLNQATISCSPSALRLSVAAAPETGQAIFIDPQRQFPANYRVTVTISDISPDSCAGVVARGHSAQATGYVVFICARGVWELARFDSHAAQPMLLATGILPAAPQQSYSVAFVTQGTVYQILINGVVTGGGDEDLYPGTDNLALIVSPSGAANFSDFAVSEIR